MLPCKRTPPARTGIGHARSLDFRSACAAVPHALTKLDAVGQLHRAFSPSEPGLIAVDFTLVVAIQEADQLDMVKIHVIYGVEFYGKRTPEFELWRSAASHFIVMMDGQSVVTKCGLVVPTKIIRKWFDLYHSIFAALAALPDAVFTWPPRFLVHEDKGEPRGPTGNRPGRVYWGDSACLELVRKMQVELFDRRSSAALRARLAAEGAAAPQQPGAQRRPYSARKSGRTKRFKIRKMKRVLMGALRSVYYRKR